MMKINRHPYASSSPANFTLVNESRREFRRFMVIPLVSRLIRRRSRIPGACERMINRSASPEKRFAKHVLLIGVLAMQGQLFDIEVSIC